MFRKVIQFPSSPLFSLKNISSLCHAADKKDLCVNAQSPYDALRETLSCQGISKSSKLWVTHKARAKKQ